MTVNTARLNWKLSKSELSLPTAVTKRDGSLVKFDIGRIERAVEACYSTLLAAPLTPVQSIVDSLATALASRHGAEVPTVEQIQDLVEVTLLTHNEVEASRSYMTYRDERAQTRTVTVPDEVRAAFEEDKKYFPSTAARFVYYDKYSRFNWDLMRRETWPETVQRTVDHLRWEVDQHKPGAVSDKDFDLIYNAILTMQVMPSMRLLAMAGDAARRNSMSLYNCSYLPVKDIQSFVEALLISMAGCGVGFSVERDYVEQFPRIKRQTGAPAQQHKVVDTTEGWGETVRIGLEAWWAGLDVEFDYTDVRPAGTVLKTKGGRASGPDPLKKAMAFLRETVLARQGEHLRTIDAHDMMCAVGDAAVQGGVRRTAMISLFDWDDADMRAAKNGPWGSWPEVRQNANNSAVWPENISDVDIAQQMLEMVKARSGEPGIFSRSNALATMPARRKGARFGTNPCGEIILRPFEFCNLSQAIARPGDTEGMLREKVGIATLIGTIQSLSTRFPGLREEWKENCEEERLLGVDLTSQVDCEILAYGTDEGRLLRDRLVQHAVEVNQHYANVLGINASVSITCNKPAGNSAEFVDGANGIHARHSQYWLRRYTVGTHGPMYRVLRASGVPMEPKKGQSVREATQWIAEMPKAAPEKTVLKTERGAVEQCEFWLLNKEHWTEHNPSCTINYRTDEIIQLINWVCDHKDRIGGLSFFPSSDAIYDQAPFEEISAEVYEEKCAAFPEVDFALLAAYEHTDMTTAAQELACFSGNGECAI